MKEQSYGNIKALDQKQSLQIDQEKLVLDLNINCKDYSFTSSLIIDIAIKG